MSIKSIPTTELPTLRDFTIEMNESSKSVLDSGMPMIEKIKDIDLAFRKAAECLNSPTPIAPAFFLYRGHSSFLAAVRLASAGQVTEAYAVVRQCLENALYANIISLDLSLAETWIKRHQSSKAEEEVRTKFSASRVLRSLKARDQNIGDIAEVLYNRTLDLGAHPNPRGHLTNLERIESKADLQFKTLYATGDGFQMDLCLKTCATTGLTVLLVYEQIYRIRFKLIHLDEELKRLKTSEPIL